MPDPLTAVALGGVAYLVASVALGAAVGRLLRRSRRSLP